MKCKIEGTAVPTLATRIASKEISAPVPAFSINRVDGTEVSSAELRGRVVVLDFWAPWCPACRREMPELEKLYHRYQGNSRVSFWAVDMQKNGRLQKRLAPSCRARATLCPSLLGTMTMNVYGDVVDVRMK